MNWGEYFVLDSESPSGLRWGFKHQANPHKGGVAGGLISTSRSQYWVVKVLGKRYQVHRIIMEMVTGQPIPPNRFIDHIDHDGTNNSIGNIRIVTPALNSRNKRAMTRDKVDGQLPTGVRFSKRKTQYKASFHDLRGVERSKHFSINKYGDADALRMAISWRKEAISNLNAMGAGYTVTHGEKEKITEL